MAVHPAMTNCVSRTNAFLTLNALLSKTNTRLFPGWPSGSSASQSRSLIMSTQSFERTSLLTNTLMVSFAPASEPVLPSTLCLRSSLGLLTLLISSAVLGETSLLERYEELRNGMGTTLPDTTISLASSEQGEELSADVASIIAHPFSEVAASLAQVENWCQFMPLHFNVKACTYQQDDEKEVLTLYSGRKTYQSPEESFEMTYHFQSSRTTDGVLAIHLLADRGPVNTRDYRLELQVQQVEEGTLIHIHSSYRPSTLSTLLTRGYLSTLGRDKVGFSRTEQDGEWQYVQGIRGVIERNIMRYHLAVDSYLSTRTLPEDARYQAALISWFRQSENYPEQLHEMDETDYLRIKRKERENQQRLQHALNKTIQLAATEEIRQPDSQRLD